MVINIGLNHTWKVTDIDGFIEKYCHVPVGDDIFILSVKCKMFTKGDYDRIQKDFERILMVTAQMWDSDFQ